MLKSLLLALLLLALPVAGVGCSFNLGPWGGPAYTLDLDRVGTGEEAINLRNDAYYQDGQPTGYRARR